MERSGDWDELRDWQHTKEVRGARGPSRDKSRGSSARGARPQPFLTLLFGIACAGGELGRGAEEEAPRDWRRQCAWPDAREPARFPRPCASRGTDAPMRRQCGAGLPARWSAGWLGSLALSARAQNLKLHPLPRRRGGPLDRARQLHAPPLRPRPRPRHRSGAPGSALCLLCLSHKPQCPLCPISPKASHRRAARLVAIPSRRPRACSRT